MYPHEESEYPDLDRVIPSLEHDVGVEPGFFGALLHENDWSFVVKLHALLEAVLTRVLADVIGRPELVPVFSFVEMSDARRGKVVFARALNLLDDGERGFIMKLSELRNNFAHDVRNIGKTLGTFMASVGVDKARAYFRALDFAPEGAGWPFGEGGKVIPRRDVFDRAPKLVIWAHAVLLLLKLHSHRESAKFHRDWEKKGFGLLEQMWQDEMERQQETKSDL